MAEGLGLGAILGGAGGAIAGSIVPGGTSVGSTLGTAFGGAIDSMFAARRADAAEPMIEDPAQRLLLEEIRAKRKAVEAGTDVSTQAGLREADLAGESTRNALVRSTGGNVAQTVDALLKSQRLEDRGKNAVLAQSQQRLPYYTGIEEQLTDKIAQRSLELGLMDQAQAQAEKAQFGKEATLNFLAGQARGDYDKLAQNAGQGIADIGENLGGAIMDYIGSLRTKKQPSNDLGLPSMPSMDVVKKALVTNLPEPTAPSGSENLPSYNVTNMPSTTQQPFIPFSFEQMKGL